MANEKRLIDANALRNALYDADAITMKGVAIINQFPTVESVEVVRCKDCKHFCKAGGLLDYDYCSQNYDCDGTHSEAYPDDFCSYGERREG